MCVCVPNYRKQAPPAPKETMASSRSPNRQHCLQLFLGALLVKLKQHHMTHAYPRLLAIALLCRVEQIYCEIWPLKSGIEVSIGFNWPSCKPIMAYHHPTRLWTWKHIIKHLVLQTSLTHIAWDLVMVFPRPTASGIVPCNMLEHCSGPPKTPEKRRCLPG